jgi:transcriptional regulator of arginine metabolism
VHGENVPISAEQREERQQAILKILRRQHVTRQDELVDLLRKRGIEATQSSISRDLRQLGVSKLDQEYRPLAEDPRGEAGREVALLAEFVVETRTAGPYQTVVKTVTGAAGQVALALDRCGWPEIVGTVSGDDTIFIATRTSGDQRRLVAKLRARFNEGTGP